MQTVIEEELSIGEESGDALQEWVDDPDALDEDKLIDLIERIGKGRFAQALASHVSEDTCPDYIRRALEHIRDAVA
jgi:putative ATP-dependent endonuclease of OLD family